MMVSGAQADFDGDFEDRADAVRRALGGLAGTSKKGGSLLGNSSQKTAMSMHQPAPVVVAPNSTNAAVAIMQIPRIPMQSTSLPPSRQQSKENVPTPNLMHQASTTVNKAGPGATTSNTPCASASGAQDLLCQLRQTEKQPSRGLISDMAFPEAAPVARPQRPQVRRNRDAFNVNGKKKTEIEKENDRLLDELEALGEEAVEIPGETPVDMNQRLRKEATTAMLKHSFFIKKRPSPPVSQGSSTTGGGFTDRS